MEGNATGPVPVAGARKGALTMADGDTVTINGCKGALCRMFELSRI